VGLCFSAQIIFDFGHLLNFAPSTTRAATAAALILTLKFGRAPAARSSGSAVECRPESALLPVGLQAPGAVPWFVWVMAENFQRGHFGFFE